MPTARELLEQADALMRRNRQEGGGPREPGAQGPRKIGRANDDDGLGIECHGRTSRMAEPERIHGRRLLFQLPEGEPTQKRQLRPQKNS